MKATDFIHDCPGFPCPFSETDALRFRNRRQLDYPRGGMPSFGILPASFDLRFGWEAAIR